MEKDLEAILEMLLQTIGSLIAGIFKGLFFGIKKLNKISNIIGLSITICISIITFFLKEQIITIRFTEDMPIYIAYIIYCCLLLSPFLYIILLGNMHNRKQEEYNRKFQEIGFKARNGKYPYLISKTEHDKRTIYIFKSGIPVHEWQAKKLALETALNCTILKIEAGNNKKIVRLTTVSSDYRLPTNVTWSDEYLKNDDGEIVIGVSALEQISFNLNRLPHVLMAGETGSGKSVLLRTCLWQMILKSCRVFMIDFKGGVEFGKRYEQYGEVITDRERALKVLTMLVEENQYRLQLFRDLEVKNLYEYNKKTGQNLCRIGVFCDEIAEMLDKKGVAKEEKEVYEKLEGKISTLARLSRATGINLFLGVQRPDANILPGQIKNNVPVRISGHFQDKSASEIVLGNTAAVNLPDIKGRFLYKVGNQTIEFQAYYFDDDTMLKDIEVETGDMLTEAPCYKPQKQTNSEKQLKQKIELNFDFDRK